MVHKLMSKKIVSSKQWEEATVHTLVQYCTVYITFTKKKPLFTGL